MCSEVNNWLIPIQSSLDEKPLCIEWLDQIKVDEGNVKRFGRVDLKEVVLDMGLGYITYLATDKGLRFDVEHLT